MFDRPFLIDLQRHIEITVMLDVIAVGIEDGCIPVPQGLVPFLVVSGKADITTASHAQLDVATGKNHKRHLATDAVMRLAILRKIHDHRVVEHRAVAFG